MVDKQKSATSHIFPFFVKLNELMVKRLSSKNLKLYTGRFHPNLSSILQIISKYRNVVKSIVID